MVLRLTLVEDAPVRGDLPQNVERVREALRAGPGADLVVFPELFLTGYRVGDRLTRLALAPSSLELKALAEAARERNCWVVVGAPWTTPDRPGEALNVALLFSPDGFQGVRAKRYLPTFGPFEEGIHLSSGGHPEPVETPWGRWGVQICYDTFFPEVSRDLSRAGAVLLIVLSASPVTSRTLFERLLPARAIENGLPVAFCNRSGVEDGLVFAGGSGVWDVRGGLVEPEVTSLGPERRLLSYRLDPEEPVRWRPFRPVLRDLAQGRSK
jgi:predicted amidohydrolase